MKTDKVAGGGLVNQFQITVEQFTSKGGKTDSLIWGKMGELLQEGMNNYD